MKFEFTPIGFFHCEAKKKYQLARQPEQELKQNPGWIEVLGHLDFEQSVHDLSGFSHLWVLFVFHEARNFKPMVQPPTGGSKRGLFATRSPHRPNPIGLSLLKIERIQGRKIFFNSYDLLDGTPILDIKPYLPRTDSVPEARSGWTTEATSPRYEVLWTKEAKASAQSLMSQQEFQLLESASLQCLSLDPFNSNHKRFSTESDHWIYSIGRCRLRVRLCKPDSFEIFEMNLDANR